MAIKRTPRIGKTSKKAFVGLGLKTDQHGDKWLSGFGGPENETWAVGDTVDIEVEQKDEYLNFKVNKVNPISKIQGDESRVFNLINLKLLPAIQFLAEDIKAIRKELLKDGYPEMDETNDSSGLDKIDLNDEPPF